MLRTLLVVNSVLVLSLLLVDLPAVRAQERTSLKEPMLIKLVHGDKEKEREKSEATRQQAERDYADALLARRAAQSAEEQQQAARQQAQAGATLDNATQNVQEIGDQVREIEQQGAIVGVAFSSHAVADVPVDLRPRGPLGIKWGDKDRKNLELLKKLANSTSSVPEKVDGNPREDAGTPKPTLVTTLSTAAEVQERIRNNRVAEDQQTAQQKAFQEELDKNIALARQEAKNDFDVVQLIKQINAHVDAAGNVDPNNDVQIREYNATADRLYYRYKQLTGKDLGFRFQRVR